MIRISDHAKVRYLERIGKFNFKVLEDYIIDNEIIRQANKAHGTGKFLNEKGNFRVVMMDFLVLTIIKIKKRKAPHPPKGE